MQNFKSVDEILEMAIKDEQRAANLYENLAKKSRSNEMRRTFLQFSLEELGHKKKLERIKTGGKIVVSDEKVQDLKIGDYLVEVNTSRDDLSYQEALIIAMKEEKAAFKLYSDLAARTDDAAAREVLLMLAQEEAKHKLRFEIEYDDHILKEHLSLEIFRLKIVFPDTGLDTWINCRILSNYLHIKKFYIFVLAAGITEWL